MFGKGTENGDCSTRYAVCYQKIQLRLSELLLLATELSSNLHLLLATCESRQGIEVLRYIDYANLFM